MRQRDPNEPTRNPDSPGTSLTAWLPVLAALAIMVTGCLSTFLVLQLDQFRPKIGDIVTFRAGTQDSDLWQMIIPATVMSSANEPIGQCSLDPNAISAKGGSIIVEARRNKPSLQYIVHWSGSATSRTSGNCGSDATLLVSRTDLQRLANAAGGFGVGEKGIVY